MKPRKHLTPLQFPPARFRAGDWVQIALGGFKGNRVEILEDQGPIGMGGRRFYMIRMPDPDVEDLVVPLAEEELEPIPPAEEKAPKKARPPRKNGGR